VFACCWIALPIIPVLFLRAYAEGDIAHDRYLYVPSIGFVLLVSLFIAEIALRLPASRRHLQLAALAIVASIYAYGTARHQIYWASDLMLYGRAYKIAPHNNLICNDLATALMDAGNSADAIVLYSRVLSRQPGFWLSNYNLGYTYYKIGRFKDAETFLRRAITINSTDSDEFLYLGLSVWRQGRTDEAVQDVQRAIEIRPSAPGYHFVSAMLHRDQNNIPAAESELKLELQYHPESTTARQQLDALTNGLH
jgi:tetratricopeptide (TPR) repeat protein